MYHEEIVQLTARIVEAERPDKVILFGSYASGTATESSDIDLLVISRSTLPRREREVRLTRQLFGSGVPYDLLVLAPEELEERLRRNGPFIREILSTIISEVHTRMAHNDRLPPIHPGEILREEFLAPLGMSAHQLALALRVPATRINDIVNEKRGITADTALRLSRYFGTTPRFWMNMQASWELEAAEDQLGNAVQREVLPRSA